MQHPSLGRARHRRPRRPPRLPRLRQEEGHRVRSIRLLPNQLRGPSPAPPLTQTSPYSQAKHQELYQCGKDQGIDIRPAAQGGDIKIGDMLFVRSGFVEAYHSKSPDERAAAAVRPHEFGIHDGQRWAGLSQEERVIDWLHDSYFAAVAGDSPTFEAWPSHEGSSARSLLFLFLFFFLARSWLTGELAHYLHEYILALWGMPLGEMLDLEKLAQKCREHNKWFFFFSSAPANCRGKHPLFRVDGSFY